MASKRKSPHKMITTKRRMMKLDRKVEILDKLQGGMSACAVGREFGINESTVRSIRKKETEIRKSFEDVTLFGATRNNFVARSGCIEKMEKLMHIWYAEMIEKEAAVSSMTMRQQALRYYEQVSEGVENPRPFSASRSWYNRFKRRFNLRRKALKSPESTEESAADAFVPMFEELVLEKGYLPEQVFNVDETWLHINNVEVQKTDEKRDFASLILCANAKGDYKCKPLMVYHSENPKSLKGKNKNRLLVHWRANSKAKVSSHIFWDWFNNCFASEVEKYLYACNLPFKVLLVLDSSSVHCGETLTHAHPNITVMFVPSSSVPFQPMEQGITKTLKAYYTRNIYKAALKMIQADRSVVMADFVKKLVMCDVIDLVHASWEEVSAYTVNNSWRNLWFSVVMNMEVFLETDAIVKDIVVLVKEIFGECCEHANEAEIEEIINAQSVEPTAEELDKMARDNLFNVDEQNDGQPKLRTFTTAKLSLLLRNMDSICREFVTIDPIMERSVLFKRTVENAMVPYRQYLLDLKRSDKQTSVNGEVLNS